MTQKKDCLKVFRENNASFRFMEWSKTREFGDEENTYSDALDGVSAKMIAVFSEMNYQDEKYVYWHLSSGGDEGKPL